LLFLSLYLLITLAIIFKFPFFHLSPAKELTSIWVFNYSCGISIDC